MADHSIKQQVVYIAETSAGYDALAAHMDGQRHPGYERTDDSLNLRVVLERVAELVVSDPE